MGLVTTFLMCTSLAHMNDIDIKNECVLVADMKTPTAKVKQGDYKPSSMSEYVRGKIASGEYIVPAPKKSVHKNLDFDLAINYAKKCIAKGVITSATVMPDEKYKKFPVIVYTRPDGVKDRVTSAQALRQGMCD